MSLHCLEGNSLECSIRLLSATHHALFFDLHPLMPDGVHGPPNHFKSYEEVKRDLPYKTLKFKVSMFQLMFAFSRFLAQNAIILVQPVLNLQKNWSE